VLGLELGLTEIGANELLWWLKMRASVIFIFNFNFKHSNYFAVRQLHMEFLRAGANVMQTFTFSASEDNMESKVNSNQETRGGSTIIFYNQNLLTGRCGIN
jgi:hypothetical protein